MTMYSGGSSWQSCNHTGTIKVFEKDGVAVFGGGSSKGVRASGMDIVLDLTGSFTPTTWPLPESWRSRELIIPGRVIKMSITDMKAPWDVGIEFWQMLWEDLQIEYVEKIKVHEGPLKVLVLCMGGHGRTGTVVSALAKASDVWGEVDIVAKVRDVYCNKAVESADQREYLATLGIVTLEKESKASYTSTPYSPPKTQPSTAVATRPNPQGFTNPQQRGGDGYKGNGVTEVPPGSRITGGGMKGRDGKWYSNAEVVRMDEGEYYKLFVDDGL